MGTTYCLGWKDYTHNFKSHEIKMTNKVIREKSNCIVCRSSKSRFLKQKHNNKFQRQQKFSNLLFEIGKTYICIVKL